MAQVYHQYGNATIAKHLTVNSGASETIVIDLVPSLTGKNIAVTIVNHSGSVSAVALYGSPDGQNWLAVTGFTTFTVAAGATGHAEASGCWLYLRVTTTGTALVDAYLTVVQ